MKMDLNNSNSFGKSNTFVFIIAYATGDNRLATVFGEAMAHVHIIRNATQTSIYSSVSGAYAHQK